MSIKVLVADDSPTIRRRASATLQEAGYAVTTVEDGAAAWALLEQGNVADVVLADILMPQLDGYDLCKRIKSHPTLKTLPVMLLRGTFEPWDEQRAMDVEADGFVTKPFEPEALLGALAELLPGGGGGASMATLEDAPDEGSPFGEDLAPASAASAPATEEADPLTLEEEPEMEVLVMEDAPAPPAPAAAAAATATAESDDPFGGADDPFGMGGSETVSAPAPAPAAPKPVAPAPAPVMAAAPAPVLAAAPVASTAVASATASVDEASLERLIEQVLKRMSAEQVEKIVWDVVPDVAEALIRKRMLEIEAKISGG